VTALAFVVVGFFAGVYASTPPYILLGWLAGTAAILIYLALDGLRRGRARRQLRRAHGEV
jgi:hypothetical protein